MKTSIDRVGWRWVRRVKVGICVLALGASVASSCGCMRSLSGQVSVHYLSIKAQTLTATTAENIERRSGACVLSNSEDVGTVKSLIHSAPATSEAFLDMLVRIRIDVGTGADSQLLAFVDSHGHVRGAGQAVRKLSQEAFEQLVTLIEANCT